MTNRVYNVLKKYIMNLCSYCLIVSSQKTTRKRFSNSLLTLYRIISYSRIEMKRLLSNVSAKLSLILFIAAALTLVQVQKDV